jgi:acyl-CoA synthetase (AMP-forming)/AMP-acid ligase II
VRRAFFGAVLAGALIAPASPAYADPTAVALNANAIAAIIDAKQTCTFAPVGSPYNMHEVTGRFILGPHPSCGSSAAYILGSAALLYALPHTKTFAIVLSINAAGHLATIANNARLMAEWKIK